MGILDPMDAVVVRTLIAATREQTAATLRLVEVVDRLCDKVDRLAGVEPDARREAQPADSAMGINGQ